MNEYYRDGVRRFTDPNKIRRHKEERLNTILKSHEHKNAKSWHWPGTLRGYGPITRSIEGDEKWLLN
jgi:hypothetical protein